jgi:hypothetical protein
MIGLRYDTTISLHACKGYFYVNFGSYMLDNTGPFCTEIYTRRVQVWYTRRSLDLNTRGASCRSQPSRASHHDSG